MNPSKRRDTRCYSGFSDTGVSNVSDSKAYSRRPSSGQSDYSRVMVDTNVKSQQTSPIIIHQHNNFGRRISSSQTSPNLYNLLHAEMEDPSNMYLTDNPMWSTGITSLCSQLCLQRQTRSWRLQNIKEGKSLINSFSIQTITSVNAETFL